MYANNRKTEESYDVREDKMRNHFPGKGKGYSSTFLPISFYLNSSLNLLLLSSICCSFVLHVHDTLSTGGRARQSTIYHSCTEHKCHHLVVSSDLVQTGSTLNSQIGEKEVQTPISNSHQLVLIPLYVISSGRC